jgi:SAM-dependent methyltransferase
VAAVFEEGERRARATSFGVVAADYERGRPAYPAEAVRWLVGPPPRRVLDLGAGTGKLTGVLVAAGYKVTAVEPLPAMLDQLRSAVPEAAAMLGSAESIPVPDASVDAVTAGQAFHWFEPGPALAEIGRVLRPGGRLGLVWNIRDESVEWVAELSRLIGTEGLTTDWSESISSSGLFGDLEHAHFRLEQHLDRATMLATVRSRSYCVTLPPDEQAEVLDAVHRLWDTHPDLAGRQTVVLPYVTHAFRASRLG